MIMIIHYQLQEPALNISAANHDQPRIVDGYKSKEILLIGLFIFTHHRKTVNRRYWQCQDRNCSSRVHTDLVGNIKKISTPHNHDGVPGKALVEEALGKGKIRATTSNEALNTIVSEVFLDIPTRFHSLQPTSRAYTKVLKAARLKAGISDIVSYRYTRECEEFIRYHEEDMVIFATNPDLVFLASCKDMFGDGTFKISPKEYTQQYTLHGLYDGVTYPCVYVLMKNRTQALYEKMLDVILGLIPGGVVPEPDSIMTDFEPAARAAFINKFPGAVVSGCYFHLGQSFWRNLQDYPDIRRLYKSDPAFARRAKRFMAMAFVPNEEVHEYWDMLLSDTIESNDGLQGFAVNYFQKTYIGQRLDNGIEVDARFPYQSWNMFQRIRDGLPRTNNSLEGWHCMMMKDLSSHFSLTKVAKKISL